MPMIRTPLSLSGMKRADGQMTNHACLRCGLESRCSHGSWADRHPAATVTAGLFTLTLMAMMLSQHPVAALTMIALAIAAGAVHQILRERRRREALAARADFEHAAWIARPRASRRRPVGVDRRFEGL
jgi:hypothetical protein